MLFLLQGAFHWVQQHGGEGVGRTVPEQGGGEEEGTGEQGGGRDQVFILDVSYNLFRSNMPPSPLLLGCIISILVGRTRSMI